MKILLADNDKRSLENLEQTIRRILPDAQIVCFEDAVLAKQYIETNEADVLFTEVCMKEVSGFTLTKLMKEKSCNTYVVFTTESQGYAIHAWGAHVNGYLLKPLTEEKVQSELDYITRESSMR